MTLGETHVRQDSLALIVVVYYDDCNNISVEHAVWFNATR